MAYAPPQRRQLTYVLVKARDGVNRRLLRA
jgi:hypothetical protein